MVGEEAYISTDLSAMALSWLVHSWASMMQSLVGTQGADIHVHFVSVTAFEGGLLILPWFAHVAHHVILPSMSLCPAEGLFSLRLGKNHRKRRWQACCGRHDVMPDPASNSVTGPKMFFTLKRRPSPLNLCFYTLTVSSFPNLLMHSFDNSP